MEVSEEQHSRSHHHIHLSHVEKSIGLMGRGGGGDSRDNPYDNLYLKPVRIAFKGLVGGSWDNQPRGFVCFSDVCEELRLMGVDKTIN